MQSIKAFAVIVGLSMCILLDPVLAVPQDTDVKRGGSPSSVRSTAASGDKSLLIVTPEYIIGPEDILEITVWKNSDLSKQVQVRPDGRISLPLLGDISAVAKTPVQFAEEISTGLRAYMENPTISIMVKEVNSFDLTGNITAYRSKIVSLPVKYVDYNSDGSTRIGAFTRAQEGQPIGEFFGNDVVGLFRDAQDVSKSPTQDGAGPGRFKYTDVNGDGKIDANDRTFFGNPNPKFTYGFNIAASYKNFDFSTFFYGSYGNDVINYVRYWTDFPQVFGGNVSKDAVYNSWSPSNLNAKVPVLAFPFAKGGWGIWVPMRSAFESLNPAPLVSPKGASRRYEPRPEKDDPLPARRSAGVTLPV